MKKYAVEVTFHDGKKFDFKTDDNVRMLQPKNINGAKLIMTKEQYAVNLIHVKEMRVTQQV
ncbi:hypothetical protein [Psychrobacillus sp.]|uniref:hypothetical protein n=1 Tax=Psychrobacillus sp. TaxID=1871623 RepID=UPI0028BD60C9|nr:hypothetical protein [Psychrobacillus sp.]